MAPVLMTTAEDWLRVESVRRTAALMTDDGSEQQAVESYSTEKIVTTSHIRGTYELSRLAWRQ